MWFGNKSRMFWVPCPRVGASYSSTGSSQSGTFLSGGAFRRQTLTAAKVFSLSWPLLASEDIRLITDFAEGVRGSGPIFWSDPFVMDKNVLAQSFATPSLGAHDGVILSGTDTRPELVGTAANGLDYPEQSATYTVSASDEPLRHWVPIPPGHVAWVGAHGVPRTGGILVSNTLRGVATGTPTPVDVTPVTSLNRVTNSFPSSTLVDGIEVYLGTGTITLAGVIVQVLPAGRIPETGGFISGQGHSGATWNDMPVKEMYSAALDLVGLSAELIETEQWT